jgi:hypothetical protein
MGCSIGVLPLDASEGSLESLCLKNVDSSAPVGTFQFGSCVVVSYNNLNSRCTSRDEETRQNHVSVITSILSRICARQQYNPLHGSG